MRPFYRTAEFCSVCHKAAVPKDLNGYRWLRMFAVYDEWQNASWAKESPLPFYKKDNVSTCQTCHMPAEPVEHDYTAMAGKAASHRWLGANTAIPVVYDYPQQLEKTSQYLKAALKMEMFALELQQPRQQLVAPLGATKFHLRPGETVTADVLITNSSIGHNLVPEQRDFYECWVEFTASDPSGHVFFHSGGLDSKGFLDPYAHTYSNRLLSGSGRLLDMHQVWETKLRGYDNTIPSGRSDLVRYRFRLPPDTKGPITITAKVNYRRFRRGFTNFVFPDQREFPIVSMATASVALAMGDNLPVDNNEQKTTLLRWNNYGVALLGEQQYWAAEEAFRKVVALDPQYGDGYINLALAQFSTLVPGKKESPDGMGNLSTSNASGREFGPALELLGKALQIRPNDARALYYKGVVLRHQGKIEDAIEQQRKVLNEFPRSRPALQELAYGYYLQGQYALAREQFELLRDINPDDLTAHFYLSIVYARLGMKDEAAQEGAAYAEHRDDPTTGSIAQDFWRSNPVLVNELAPYHIHESSLNPPKHVTVGGYLP
jgi:Flp pilus assembly protein TadD